MTTTDSLDDLLARTGLGDRAAFKVVYERTSAKLFGICLRILKDRQEAEEVLQEAYVKIWRNAGRYVQAKAALLAPLGRFNPVAGKHISVMEQPDRVARRGHDRGIAADAVYRPATCECESA